MGLSTPGSSVGAEALRADGYRFVVDVEPDAGRLRRAGPPQQRRRPFASSTTSAASYVRDERRADVRRRSLARPTGCVVAARELHVAATSRRGMPGERSSAACAIVAAGGQGRSSSSSAWSRRRPGARVARAWVLQLLVQDGPCHRMARRSTSSGSRRSKGSRYPVRPRVARPPEWGPAGIGGRSRLRRGGPSRSAPSASTAGGTAAS